MRRGAAVVGVAQRGPEPNISLWQALAIAECPAFSALQAASDSMDAACDAVQLSWVLRKGLKVLSKLEVEDTPEHFVTRIKAGGIMDVVER